MCLTIRHVKKKRRRRRRSLKQKSSEIGEPGQARLENPKNILLNQTGMLSFSRQNWLAQRAETRSWQKISSRFFLSLCVSKNVIKFSLYFLSTFQMTWHFHSIITSGSKVSVRNNNPARPSTSKNQCKVVWLITSRDYILYSRFNHLALPGIVSRVSF